MTAENEEKEPAPGKEVQVSIVTDQLDGGIENVVHIDDQKYAEVIKDAEVKDDGAAVNFKSDTKWSTNSE